MWRGIHQGQTDSDYLGGVSVIAFTSVICYKKLPNKQIGTTLFKTIKMRDYYNKEERLYSTLLKRKAEAWLSTKGSHWLM